MNLKMTFEKTWNRIAIKVIKPVADVRSKKHTHTYYKYHDDFGRIVKKKKKDTQWSLWSIMTSSESPTRTEQKTSTRWTTWAVQGMPKCSVRILSLEAAEAVAGNVGTREDVRFAHALTSSVLWRL